MLLIILCIGLLWLWVNAVFLREVTSLTPTTAQPLVSILIPLRNEEDNVLALIKNLKELSYPNVEVILLDDGSTDRTAERLQSSIQDNKAFTIIQGSPLPDGWNGKVYACHQLSRLAKGEFFLFIDADVRLHPETIQYTLAHMEAERIDLLSGFPNYPLIHKGVQLLVPMQHFVVWAHLPMFIANRTNHAAFTAACGQFMFFRKNAYVAIGGHESVKNSLLEDVHLARRMKEYGWTMKLLNISSLVTCHMYTSMRSLWEGFTKNIYVGIGQSKVLAILLSGYYAFVYLFPFPLAIYGIVTFQPLYVIPYLLTVLQKWIVDRKTGTHGSFAWAVPISASLLIAVLATSMYKAIRGQSYSWKGRMYT
ncbi:glycosyltransferase [Pontibacillus halophilus]|nr:glycosyltransferase family 2 protein [Pontibacillus halophilus]